MRILYIGFLHDLNFMVSEIHDYFLTPERMIPFFKEENVIK